MKRALLVGLLALASFPALAVPPAPSFVEFESGAVRPVALTPNGQYLLVANIPDNRLEVFDVLQGGGLSHTFSIPVGMEPVAVAARTDTEIWVVNHLSDSVSIVDLTTMPPRVVRTLIVGDEPRDIVFAGTGGTRAFITTAHRGQQRTDASISGVTGAGDPQLTTQGTGRADVWVFDAGALGTTFGGTPLRILTFFADTPRALATDGTNVFVAAFQSGNQSTAIIEACVRDGFGTATAGLPQAQCPIQATVPGGVPGPSTNCRQDDADPACEESANAPETGVIVKFNGSNWLDPLNRSWNTQVPFNLPDRDVFTVNANTFATGTIYQHVGTILFNMARNPISGKIYVTNTDSPNLTMFEGPGIFGGSTVQGHLSESRITVLNPSNGAVDVRHLNKHINYSLLHTSPTADHAAINAQKAHSLATPLQPVVSSDGATIYVPAFGSSKIGVFSTASLENDTFDPTTASANYITTTGGGPAGLALDEVNNRLYVLTRFDNTLQIINPTTKATVASIPLTNPEPVTVINGRRFLYDAQLTSGNGEASCASCHIFGDFDSLAWDLGNPDDGTSSNTQPSASPFLPPANTFHPMKGPMTTQTLRGMATEGGMHWRGDRVSGYFGTDPCNNSGPSNAPCDEAFSFNNFIVAFAGLVGGQATVDNGGGKPLAVLSTAQMQQFTNFILQVFLPPNPIRPLNNTITGSALAGHNKFFSCGGSETSQVNCPAPGGGGPQTDTVEDCDGCHDLNPSLGFFGSGGQQSFEGEPQNAKVPHYRNLYTKVGMFSLGVPGGSDQVRGFGFLHDGSVDTLFTFHSAPVFTLTDQEQRDLEQFGFQFPTDLAPIVGQQVTLTSTNGGVVNPRIDLFIQRAGTTYNSWMLGGAVPECDVVVKGSVGGIRRGWVREASGSFRDDLNALWNDGDVRALANSEGPLTYTCAPPGSGRRMGIDQNLDGTLDGLPEPGSLLSLASGAALLAALARRRQRTTMK
jgi:YVTN family beta-propeller protein